MLGTPDICLSHIASQFSQYHLFEETVFSPLYMFASFVKDKVPVGAWIYLWAFYLVPLVYITVLGQYHAVLMTVDSFVVEPEGRKVYSFSSILLS